MKDKDIVEKLQDEIDSGDLYPEFKRILEDAVFTIEFLRILVIANGARITELTEEVRELNSPVG